MSQVRVVTLAVGLLVAALVGVLATRQAGPDRANMHLVGQVAPPIVGTTVDGEVSSIPSTRTADSDHRASAIFKQIRSVIPPLIMNELMKLREKYEQDYEK